MSVVPARADIPIEAAPPEWLELIEAAEVESIASFTQRIAQLERFMAHSRQRLVEVRARMAALQQEV